MIIKGLVDEDFVNYKKPSMFIAFPSCTFKCEKECGMQVCQNGALATAEFIDIDMENIIDRYLNNPLTHSVVIGGLEPFDTWIQLFRFVIELRKKTADDIVIYTGYYENEIDDYINRLKPYKNIIVKFGRYIPNQTPHLDEVLGIELASSNQYAVIIS